MAIDLKSMTRKELEKLERDVQKALVRVKKQDLKKVRLEMERLAASHGVSVDEVMGTKAPRAVAKKTRTKGKAAAKYANPADASQTWTGKGRQPKWFKAAIDAGKSPDSMEL